MNETQLDSIEKAVGFALPAEYRRVAASPPFRPIGHDWVYWFYDDPSRVIEGTLAPLADGGYDQSHWQAGYLTIGESGGGDLYVMDTTVADLPVLCLCHETHAIEPAWPSFSVFVEDWIRTSGEIAQQRFNPTDTELRRRMRLGWIILAVSLGVPIVAWWVLWLLR